MMGGVGQRRILELLKAIQDGSFNQDPEYCGSELDTLIDLRLVRLELTDYGKQSLVGLDQFVAMWEPKPPTEGAAHE